MNFRDFLKKGQENTDVEQDHGTVDDDQQTDTSEDSVETTDSVETPDSSDDE